MNYALGIENVRIPPEKGLGLGVSVNQARSPGRQASGLKPQALGAGRAELCRMAFRSEKGASMRELLSKQNIDYMERAREVAEK